MMIRILTPEDASAFWRLRLKALKEHPEAFGASYEDSRETPIEAVRERLVSSSSVFVLGAFADTGELAGMVGFRQETSKKMRHKGMVWGMYVDKAVQGQGVGKKLLTELVMAVEKVPEIEQINLMVTDTNIPAKRLYESLGFITYGKEVNAMKWNEVEYVNEDLMVRRMNRALQ